MQTSSEPTWKVLPRSRLFQNMKTHLEGFANSSTTFPSLSLFAAVSFSSTVRLWRGFDSSLMKIGRSSGTPELLRLTPAATGYDIYPRFSNIYPWFLNISDLLIFAPGFLILAPGFLYLLLVSWYLSWFPDSRPWILNIIKYTKVSAPTLTKKK